MPTIGIGIGPCYRGINPGGAAPVWSPLELAPVLWLKADAGTFQTSGGIAALAYADPVGEWQDQSGNGFHVTATTDAKRPSLITGAQNGRPGLRFDGTDDFLQLAANLSLGDFTLFAAVRRAAGGGGDAVIAGSKTVGDVSYLADFYTPDHLLYFHDGTVGGATSVAGFENDTAAAYCFRRSGSTLQVYRDGTQVGTDIAYSATAQPFGMIAARNAGVSNFWTGDFFEVGLVTRAITLAERTNLAAYLAAGWGTP